MISMVFNMVFQLIVSTYSLVIEIGNLLLCLAWVACATLLEYILPKVKAQCLRLAILICRHLINSLGGTDFEKELADSRNRETLKDEMIRKLELDIKDEVRVRKGMQEFGNAVTRRTQHLLEEKKAELRQAYGRITELESLACSRRSRRSQHRSGHRSAGSDVFGRRSSLWQVESDPRPLPQIDPTDV